MGRRKVKSSVSNATREKDLIAKFEAAKLKRNNRASSNKHSTNNDSLWLFNADLVKNYPYLHNRKGHFNNALHNGMADSIMDIIKNTCFVNIKQKINDKLVEEKKFYNYVKNKTFGPNKETYLQYIANDSFTQELVAIKRFINMLNMAIDAYYVLQKDDKKSDRVAGDYYVYVHDGNKVLWDETKQGKISNYDLALKIVDSGMDESLSLIKEFGGREQLALSMSKFLDSVSASLQNERIKGNVTDRDKNYSKNVKNCLDIINKTAKENNFNISGDTIYDRLMDLMKKGYSATKSEITFNSDKAIHTTNIFSRNGSIYDLIEGLKKEFSLRTNLGFLFEHVRVYGLQSKDIEAEKYTGSTKKTASDVIITLDEINSKMGITMKFFRESDVFSALANKQHAFTFKEIIEWGGAQGAQANQLYYFLINYFVLSTSALSGETIEKDNAYLDMTVISEILNLLSQLVSILYFARNVFEGGLSDVESWNKSSEVMPGILNVNNNAIYTFDLLESLYKSFGGEMSFIQIDTHPIVRKKYNKELQSLANVKKRVRPKNGAELTYQDYVDDSDVMNICTSIANDISSTGYYKKGNIAINLTDAMERLKTI